MIEAAFGRLTIQFKKGFCMKLTVV